MRTIVLFSIAITMMAAGVAAWSASTHSAVKAEPPQIDPLSLEANAKNLPSQEELKSEIVATGRRRPLMISGRFWHRADIAWLSSDVRPLGVKRT